MSTKGNTATILEKILVRTHVLGQRTKGSQLLHLSNKSLSPWGELQVVEFRLSACTGTLRGWEEKDLAP